jgi:hypothetical protein
MHSGYLTETYVWWVLHQHCYLIPWVTELRRYMLVKILDARTCSWIGNTCPTKCLYLRWLLLRWRRQDRALGGSPCASSTSDSSFFIVCSKNGGGWGEGWVWMLVVSSGEYAKYSWCITNLTSWENAMDKWLKKC